MMADINDGEPQKRFDYWNRDIKYLKKILIGLSQ